MNRGIYVNSAPQLPSIRTLRAFDNLSTGSLAAENRIHRVLQRARSVENVRSWDPDRPYVMAKAMRLSQLYGASLDSEVVRNGVDRGSEKRASRPTPRDEVLGDSPIPSRAGRQGKTVLRRRKERRNLRLALEKAAQAASQYTLPVVAGMKAFDGPHLGPEDVRDLLRRIFRITLSMPEATALVKHFTQESRHDRIEHGDFLHAIQRMRRDLEARATSNKQELPGVLRKRRAGMGPSFLMADRKSRQKGLGQKMDPQRTAIMMRALAKVDRAASAYDSRRVEGLREADLSGATSPRAFGGVLLSRFDVRVEAAEREALVALLLNEDGVVDVERFRVYFLGLVDGDVPAMRRGPECEGGEDLPSRESTISQL